MNRSIKFTTETQTEDNKIISMCHVNEKALALDTSEDAKVMLRLNRSLFDKINSSTKIVAGSIYREEVIKEKGKRFKIILTQILRETLWDTIKNGQVIEGTVKDVKKFGTLINLDEETVGLIHTSEMQKINKSFDKGDSVSVKVLSVDRTSRKIFLTVA